MIGLFKKFFKHHKEQDEEVLKNGGLSFVGPNSSNFFAKKWPAL